MTAELLATLQAEFARARAEQLDHAEADVADRCRYCGRFWRRRASSKLDGHAKCVVPLWFKRWLSELFSVTPTLTFPEVAAALGVSIAIARAWVVPISKRGAA